MTNDIPESRPLTRQEMKNLINEADMCLINLSDMLKKIRKNMRNKNETKSVRNIMLGMTIVNAVNQIIGKYDDVQAD